MIAGSDFDIAYVAVAGAPPPTATSITARSSLDETTPALQPGRVRLAYTQVLGSQSDIQTAYSDDGTDEYALAVDPLANEWDPAFSPDSTEVVYATDSGLVIAASGGADRSGWRPDPQGHRPTPTGRSARRATPPRPRRRSTSSRPGPARRRRSAFGSARASPARASSAASTPAAFGAVHRRSATGGWSPDATASRSARSTPPGCSTARRPGPAFGSRQPDPASGASRRRA